MSSTITTTPTYTTPRGTITGRDGLIFTRNIRGPGVELVSWAGSGTPNRFNPAPKIEIFDGVDGLSACPRED